MGGLGEFAKDREGLRQRCGDWTIKSRGDVWTHKGEGETEGGHLRPV